MRNSSECDCYPSRHHLFDILVNELVVVEREFVLKWSLREEQPFESLSNPASMCTFLSLSSFNNSKVLCGS